MHCSQSATMAKGLCLIEHPLEVVSGCSETQLQVLETFDLFQLEINLCQHELCFVEL